MRTDAPGLGHVAAGLVLASTVDVWHGGRAVALGVPVGGGRVVAQVDQDVPERLDSLILPREHDGLVLDPSMPGGVLGVRGQRVHVTATLTTLDGGRRWVLPMGRFVVTSVARDGAGLVVSGTGLLSLVRDHLRARPGGVGKASPMVGVIMGHLADDGLEGYFAPGLPSRTVPSGFTWGEDRLASLQELVAAWPARMRATWDGRVGFFPPLTEDVSPVAFWHDGEGGTVVSAPIEHTREGLFNHVIVPVKGGAGQPQERWVKTGGLAVQDFGWVSRRIETGAITSVPQAQAVAVNELAAAGVRSATIPVETAPDWRVELDDDVEVVTHDGLRAWGRVTGLDLPLSVADGAARYDVGVSV